MLELFFENLHCMFIDMAFYIMLGLFFVGLLNTYVKREKVLGFLGKDNFASVVKASVIGVPLPLCSCGVVPTAVELKKSGASNGAVTSFLVSTPQTGVDSILATYSMMGIILAVFRPLAAFASGIITGTLVNVFAKDEVINTEIVSSCCSSSHSSETNSSSSCCSAPVVETCCCSGAVEETCGCSGAVEETCGCSGSVEETCGCSGAVEETCCCSGAVEETCGCSGAMEETCCCSGAMEETCCCSGTVEESCCCSAPVEETCCCSGSVEETCCCSTPVVETCCSSSSSSSSGGCCSSKNVDLSSASAGPKFIRVFKYAYGEFLDGISFHFVIGLLLATVIATFVPADLFVTLGLNSGIIAMLAMVLVGLPMYICSTSSIPIALSLLTKGLSLGSVFVFLFTGPVTNIASILMLSTVLGKKITVLYISIVVACSLGFGLLLDYFVSVSQITTISEISSHHHSGSFMSIVAVIFFLLLIKSLIKVVPAKFAK